MNVALTRARRHLFVVGDSQTVSHHPFLKSMCKYLQTEGDLRSPETAATAVVVCTTSTETCEIPHSYQKSYKNARKKDYGTKNCDLSNSQKCKPSVVAPKQSVANNRTIKENDSNNEMAPMACSSNSKLEKKVVQTNVIFHQIEDFSKSSLSELVFPCSLTAKERAFVHEISDQFRLSHISCGEGGNRRIVVRKMDNRYKSGLFYLISLYFRFFAYEYMYMLCVSASLSCL